MNLLLLFQKKYKMFIYYGISYISIKNHHIVRAVKEKVTCFHQRQWCSANNVTLNVSVPVSFGLYHNHSLHLSSAVNGCEDSFLFSGVRVNLLLPPVGNYCNRTWDGWMCWGDSTPGTAMQMCPTYFQDFDPGGETFCLPVVFLAHFFQCAFIDDALNDNLY